MLSVCTCVFYPGVISACWPKQLQACPTIPSHNHHCWVILITLSCTSTAGARPSSLLLWLSSKEPQIISLRCWSWSYGKSHPLWRVGNVYQMALVTVDEVLGWISGGFLSPISRQRWMIYSTAPALASYPSSIAGREKNGNLMSGWRGLMAQPATWPLWATLDTQLLQSNNCRVTNKCRVTTKCKQSATNNQPLLAGYTTAEW